MSTVGDNILWLRKKIGLTQEELANKMGYKSKSTINKIELGINDIPQSKIAKFAEVLGTTPAFLMGWAEEQKKNDIQSDIILRMRSDKAFMSAVESLYALDEDKLESVSQFLNTFLK